jgi:O-antigen/teichoic acid export membrane protein
MEEKLTTSSAALATPTLAVPHRLSLRSNFAWTLAGTVVYAGCQWGMIVVLARLGDPSMVGALNLGLAVTAPVFMFANLNLRGVQATDARREFEFSDYLGLRLLTIATAILVVAGIVLISGYSPTIVGVVLLVALAKGFESLSDVFYGLSQRHERMDRIAVSLVARGVLSLGVLAVAVLLTRSILWGTAGLAAAWALVLAFYDIPGAQHLVTDALRPRWNRATLTRLVSMTLPLGLAMFLISLNTNIPRYFIEGNFGLHDLGIYSALFTLTMVGSTIELAMGHAAHPRLAAHFAAGEQTAFRSLLFKQLAVASVLALGGVLGAFLIGRPFLGLVYGSEYAEHASLLPWILLGTGIGYVASQLNFGMTAARSFFIQAPLFVAVITVTFTACALLVPTYGLTGAALAIVCGFGFQLVAASVIMTVILRREVRS